MGVEAGLFDGEVGDFADNPLEVVGPDGVEVGVGGGIHEVDGVWDAVFDSELDGVEIIAEGLAEGEGVAFDACEEALGIFGRIEDVALGVGQARVVGHDVDFFLADDVAAEILVEVDGLLVGHAEVAGLVVSLKELAAIVDVVDVAPSTAVDGFHEAVLADVVEYGVPIEGVLEVAHGAVGGALWVDFVGQDDGGGGWQRPAWRRGSN